MGSIKYRAPTAYGGFLGKKSIGSLGELDSYLNVSINNDMEEAHISSLNVSTCDGIYCKLDELGMKAHHP